MRSTKLFRLYSRLVRCNPAVGPNTTYLASSIKNTTHTPPTPHHQKFLYLSCARDLCSVMNLTLVLLTTLVFETYFPKEGFHNPLIFLYHVNWMPYDRLYLFASVSFVPSLLIDTTISINHWSLWRLEHLSEYGVHLNPTFRFSRLRVERIKIFLPYFL